MESKLPQGPGTPIYREVQSPLMDRVKFVLWPAACQDSQILDELTKSLIEAGEMGRPSRSVSPNGRWRSVRCPLRFNLPTRLARADLVYQGRSFEPIKARDFRVEVEFSAMRLVQHLWSDMDQVDSIPFSLPRREKNVLPSEPRFLLSGPTRSELLADQIRIINDNLRNVRSRLQMSLLETRSLGDAFADIVPRSRRDPHAFIRRMLAEYFSHDIIRACVIELCSDSALDWLNFPIETLTELAPRALPFLQRYEEQEIIGVRGNLTSNVVMKLYLKRHFRQLRCELSITGAALEGSLCSRVWDIESTEFAEERIEDFWDSRKFIFDHALEMCRRGSFPIRKSEMRRICSHFRHFNQRQVRMMLLKLSQRGVDSREDWTDGQRQRIARRLEELGAIRRSHRSIWILDRNLSSSASTGMGLTP